MNRREALKAAQAARSVAFVAARLLGRDAKAASVAYKKYGRAESILREVLA